MFILLVFNLLMFLGECVKVKNYNLFGYKYDKLFLFEESKMKRNIKLYS